MADGVMDGMYYGRPVRGVGEAVEEVDLSFLRERTSAGPTPDSIGPFLPLFGLVVLALSFALSKAYNALKATAGDIGVEIEPGAPKKQSPQDLGLVSFTPTVARAGDPEADALEDELQEEIRRRGINRNQ